MEPNNFKLKVSFKLIIYNLKMSNLPKLTRARTARQPRALSYTSRIPLKDTPCVLEISP